MFVLLLFFCSGATALIYEVLWSKYLAMLLGSTVQAQTVVLAVFMGGLAIGNRLFGKFADSSPKPLGVYGYLEILIGIYAFCFYKLYTGADWVFIKAGRGLLDHTWVLFLIKLAISVFLLIIPTILMGGTLPLLAAWIQRQKGLDAGSRVGIFYATNSLGAVAGAWLAGFVLVQSMGMISSIEITALGNLLIGLAAILLNTREAKRMLTRTDLEQTEAPSRTAVADIGGFGLLVAATGAVSMGLEVVSSRALVLMVGGSLQAFAIVLMSFIFGIGIGSVVISSSRTVQNMGRWTIYVLVLGAAVEVSLNVLFIEQISMFYSKARFGLALNEAGYTIHQIMLAAISFVGLGIPAAFLGAVVPMAIALQGEGTGELGNRVGRLLTWNTIGAVVGVLLTGFLLMPLFGMRGALVALVMTLFVVAIVVAHSRDEKGPMMVSAALAMMFFASAASTGENWKWIFSAGMFRMRGNFVDAEVVNTWRNFRQLLFYKDGPDATVTVEKSLATNDFGEVGLRINGKADASSRGDLSTQYLLAHLPMFAKPDAKQVFILGFGSGITAGAFLGHPVERITIAENCGPVLEAGVFFSEFNRGVLTNSRVTIRRDDARAVLKLSPRNFDVIISEPSNPWVAGVGSVFSQEFYELAASRLNEGGIMAQWFHVYEMNDAIVAMILRTFSRVFPHMEIWDTQAGDIVMLGSKKAWQTGPAQFEKIFDRETPRKDLAEIGMKTPASVRVRLLASQGTAFAIPGDGPVQTDEFPVLEYEAPRTFFMGRQSGMLSIYDERTLQFPLMDPERLAAARALEPKVILDVLGIYGSCNKDVTDFSKAVKQDPVKLPGLYPFLEVAYRAPESYPAKARLGPNAPEEEKQLTELQLKMLRQPEHWREAAAEMEPILAKLLETGHGRANFVAITYPVLAAKFAIGHGDYQVAIRMLKLAFAFNESDDQALYLSRVLDRILPQDYLTNPEIRKVLGPVAK